MAAIAEPTAAPAKPISADTFERILALGALLLLAAALTALARGYSEWGRVPWQVWPHLGTILIALALTPVMLLRRRGDRKHRLLGRIWVIAMLATALLSFNLRLINRGDFSLIHLLSAWTLIQAPLIWWSARTHRVTLHRRTVRGMVTGALLIAGFFTFPFDRLLGHWLFG
ncbi:hypothetical protein [Sphingomonas sp.]|jgi:uncharacterized membrane protein|uniref:DUF2306 domain-containing protein n=1 Tax=Sphingomonas sp. TaxID=28214 RepID=UPI002ED89F6E